MKLAALSGLVDGSKIDNGVWIHLTGAKKDADGNPVPLYLNDDPRYPCRALVRSNRSKTVREMEEKLRRSGFVRIAKAKGAAQREEAQADAIQLPPDKRFAALLAKLENCDSDPGVLEVTPEMAAEIYADSDYCLVVEQVTACAYDDERYVGAAEAAELKAKDEAEAGEKKASAGKA